jgi:hypothetical protein
MLGRNLVRGVAVLAFLAVAAVFTVPSRAAICYCFDRFTNNSVDGDAVAPQLSMCVSSDQAGLFMDPLSTVVWFTFTNNVGIASSITDIYWDDNAAGTPTVLASLMTIVNSAGVSFDTPAAPPNLPGGGVLVPPFSADFSADSDAPASPNGVNAAGEFVKFKFTLKPAKTLADVIGALNLNILRVGMHVQSIGRDSNSDGFLARQCEVVPEPGSMAVWGVGLALVACIRRLRKRQTV